MSVSAFHVSHLCFYMLLTISCPSHRVTCICLFQPTLQSVSFVYRFAPLLLNTTAYINTNLNLSRFRQHMSLPSETEGLSARLSLAHAHAHAHTHTHTSPRLSPPPPHLPVDEASGRLPEGSRPLLQEAPDPSCRKQKGPDPSEGSRPLRRVQTPEG